MFWSVPPDCPLPFRRPPPPLSETGGSLCGVLGQPLPPAAPSPWQWRRRAARCGRRWRVEAPPSYRASVGVVGGQWSGARLSAPRASRPRPLLWLKSLGGGEGTGVGWTTAPGASRSRRAGGSKGRRRRTTARPSPAPLTHSVLAPLLQRFGSVPFMLEWCVCSLPDLCGWAVLSPWTVLLCRF